MRTLTDTLWGGYVGFFPSWPLRSARRGFFLFDILYIAFRMWEPARCGVVLTSSKELCRIKKINANRRKEVDLSCEVSLLQGR